LIPKERDEACPIYLLYLNMEKSLKIVQLKAKDTDFLYWSSKSEIERLEAVEMLRQQYINYKKDVQPGLQRVCSIINKK
jgi:hypothetical protein